MLHSVSLLTSLLLQEWAGTEAFIQCCLGGLEFFTVLCLSAIYFTLSSFPPVRGERHLPSLLVQEGMEGDRPTPSLPGTALEAGSPRVESRHQGKRETPSPARSLIQGLVFPSFQAFGGT